MIIVSCRPAAVPKLINSGPSRVWNPAMSLQAEYGTGDMASYFDAGYKWGECSPSGCVVPVSIAK